MKTDFAANLAAARARAGLSQTDVARRAGLPKQVINRLERGHVTGPTLTTIGALAKALDCTLAELVDPQNASRPAAAVAQVAAKPKAPRARPR